MEELLKELLLSVNSINDNINRIDDSIHQLEQRLARLEKMDSIEHRVTVNQIDITDIKEFLEKMEITHKEEFHAISEVIKSNLKEIKLDEEIERINKRLDAQLTKIAQHEESLLMYSQNKK